MQLGVRHERSAFSENVEKASTNERAVVSLVEEEASVVMIIWFCRYSRIYGLFLGKEE